MILSTESQDNEFGLMAGKTYKFSFLAQEYSLLYQLELVDDKSTASPFEQSNHKN